MWRVLLVFCLGLWACDSLEKKSDVVVQIGETQLTKAMLREMVVGWDSLSAEDQVAFLQAWVDEELLYREARARGLDKRPEMKQTLIQARKKILADRLSSEVADSVVASEKDARAYYEAHPEKFLIGEHSWSGAVVSFKTKKHAAAFYKERKKFKSLEKVQGDSRVRKVAQFENSASSPDSCLAEDLRKVPLNKLSEPKECGKTFKSLLVLSHTDSAEVRPFESVEAEALALAKAEKRKKKLEAFRLDLKKRTPVFSDWKQPAGK